MTETAHTPLPWAVSSGCDQYICNGDSWIASTMGIRGEEGAANTRFIVQAVNNHHRLVEMVERFVADYDDNDRADAGIHPLMEAHIANFRAALKEAGR